MVTCLEKYLQEHPNDDGNPVEDSCPNLCGIPIPDPDYCNGGCVGECESCWNRQIPGTEDKTLADAFIQAGASAVKTGDALQKMAEAAKDMPPYILDSGERRRFDTGAVRDIQEGKGRCDLMPLDVVTEITGDPVIAHIANFMETGDRGHLRTALDVFAGSNYPDMLLEVAKHFEEGAKKYGENNWQKGIPVRCYIDSAVRHYLKFQRGDKDEPHNRAFCWNIITACWTCKHKPELNDYRQVKNEDTCICCGASIPEGQQACPHCMVHVKGGA